MPDREREGYTPSGRFDPGTLAVRGLVGLGLGALLACGLAWLTSVDYYAVGWLTLVLVLVLSSWARWTVREARCRNPLVAAVAAGGLGAATMLAHFHVDQCQRWGVGWERLDRLPGFVAFRMETDRWWAPDLRLPCRAPEPVNPATVPWRSPAPGATAEWAVLLAELLAVGLVPAVVGWRAAVRPFDEVVGDWCVHDRVAVTPESARRLREALAGGDLRAWAQAGFERGAVGAEHEAVDVWYSPRRPGSEPDAASVYVSVGGRWPVRLTPEEAAALAVLLPEVGTLAAVPEEWAAAGEPGPGEPHLARLARVPGERVGRAKNLGVKYLGRALALAVSAAPLAGLFALAGAAYLLNELGVEGLALLAVVIRPPNSRPSGTLPR